MKAKKYEYHEHGMGCQLCQIWEHLLLLLRSTQGGHQRSLIDGRSICQVRKAAEKPTLEIPWSAALLSSSVIRILPPAAATCPAQTHPRLLSLPLFLLLLLLLLRARPSSANRFESSTVMMALRSLIGRRTLAPSPAAVLQSSSSSRGLKTASLPDLPYDYGALEPVISAEIMTLHHRKHHQAYVSNYNKALEQLDGAMNRGDPSTVVKLQSAIKFNGGGHINHSIFWKNLAPANEGGGEPPRGSLGWAIDTHFGSLESLKQKMNAEGAALQGSGWVWLGVDRELKHLVVETTANQDPLVTKGPSLVPLIGIDVWEHAYYPQYKNVKADYLNNIWKVINWKYGSDVYEKECS